VLDVDRVLVVGAVLDPELWPEPEPLFEPEPLAPAHAATALWSRAMIRFSRDTPAWSRFAMRPASFECPNLLSLASMALAAWRRLSALSSLALCRWRSLVRSAHDGGTGVVVVVLPLCGAVLGVVAVLGLLGAVLGVVAVAAPAPAALRVSAPTTVAPAMILRTMCVLLGLRPRASFVCIRASERPLRARPRWRRNE
jgi:hypothetical protein